MAHDTPEAIIRSVVDECADCDICRHLMDSSCLVFPALYRLWDREIETGEAITPGELHALVNLCNYCALCPCAPVREKLLRAKMAFVERDGLPRRVRVVEDVARIHRLCNAFPAVSNMVLNHRITLGWTRRLLGIHPERQLPSFPKSDFFQWAKSRGVCRRPASGQRRKVLYFAGCTAGYLFPEVARSAVVVMQACGAAVWVAPQNCCGMPPLLEGDKALADRFVSRNIETLAAAADDGFDIVCSCPTCGYFLKTVLSKGAVYADAYQQRVGGDDRIIKIRSRRTRAGSIETPDRHLDRKIYGRILTDDGLFSGIDANRRMAVADRVSDLGEYLGRLREKGLLPTDQRRIPERSVYFPPCHLREQNIGRPYETLISDLPGMALEQIPGALLCCGMGGVMGFKESFHPSSRAIGSPLMDNIRSIDPHRIITDCLSCRLQFNQCLDYPVSHPVEVIHERLAETCPAPVVSD